MLPPYVQAVISVLSGVVSLIAVVNLVHSRRKEHDEVQDRDDRVHHERERIDFSAQETKVQKAQDEGEQRDGPGRVNVLGRVFYCAQQQESG